jgi:catechol 2,3-dioxygenase-like lactoylglutathione lyase family enzyme
MKPLHAIWEPVHDPASIGVVPARYPNSSQTSPAKVKVTGINQVAIVVKDLQRTMEDYWNILGIGPWDVYSWEAPLVYDRKYHGKPAQTREKIAETRVGGVVLELCQPIAGDSIYRDFLTERGEGLHHLNFLVDDVDATTEILSQQGFSCLQSGRFGPIEENGAYSYIDIKPLLAIWEPVHEPESIGVVPARYP